MSKKLFLLFSIFFFFFSGIIQAKANNPLLFGPPTDLKAAKISANEVLLKWRAVSQAEYYVLRLLNKRGGLIKNFKNITDNKKKIGKRHLKPNTVYKFKVKACRIDLCSKFSAEKKFKTKKAAQEFTIIASEFSFSPSSIRAVTDQTIKITFKNNGKTPHNFTVAGVGKATKTISPGASEILEFIVPEKGTYAFYCSISGHREAGMEGALIVE